METVVKKLEAIGKSDPPDDPDPDCVRSSHVYFSVVISRNCNGSRETIH